MVAVCLWETEEQFPKWLNNSAPSHAMSWDFLFFSFLEEVNEKLWLLVDLHAQDLGLFIHFLNNVFDEKRFLILEKLKWSLFSFVVSILWLTYRIFSQPKVTQVFTCVFTSVFFGKVCGSSFILNWMIHQKLILPQQLKEVSSPFFSLWICHCPSTVEKAVMSLPTILSSLVGINEYY